VYFFLNKIHAIFCEGDEAETAESTWERVGIDTLHLIWVRIGPNDSLCALANLLQGVEDRATENCFPTWARHLRDHNGRIDTIVWLVLVLPGVPVEAKFAKVLLHLRLSLVGI